METVIWLVAGVMHSLIHPDSSFFTLMWMGYGKWWSIVIILTSNTLCLYALYYLNKFGIPRVQRVSFYAPSCLKVFKEFFQKVKDLLPEALKRFFGKLEEWAERVVRNHGQLGVAVVCLIPYLPMMRETALATGIVRQIKYTLPIVILSNSARVIAASLIQFFIYY